MDIKVPYHAVDRIIKRRDHILRHVPCCHACQDEQVQIINFTPPAIWKCRVCKYTFACEPPADD